MRITKIAALTAAAAALSVTLAGVAAADSDDHGGTPAGRYTQIGTPDNVALGTFTRQLTGSSEFVQSGSNIDVYGQYRGLDKSRAFFTVIYANKNCDPAQAFPVGPFTTDSHGRALFAAQVPGNGVQVSGTMSVSVRYADTDRNGNFTDQDGDNKTGPTDVVAVPGSPTIGLRECNGVGSGRLYDNRRPLVSHF